MVPAVPPGTVRLVSFSLVPRDNVRGEPMLIPSAQIKSKGSYTAMTDTSSLRRVRCCELDCGGRNKNTGHIVKKKSRKITDEWRVTSYGWFSVMAAAQQRPKW